MTELYWITVLGKLSTVAIIMMVLSTILTPVSLIVYLSTLDEYGEKFTNGWLMAMKISATTLVISVLCCIFIPSTNQLYAIYGIGGTLDYLKENKEAQKLPDNILKAVNTYLEQSQEENKQNK